MRGRKEIEQIPFGIYYIKSEYLDYIRKGNEHVSYSSQYTNEGRSEKFYCGPVFTDRFGASYFAPISSKNAYDKTLKNRLIGKYCVQITNNNQQCGCIDFRYMVPCPKEELTPKTHMSEFAKKQTDFCRSKENLLRQVGNRTYVALTENPQMVPNACDFKKEIKWMKYYQTTKEVERQKLEKMKKRETLANQMRDKTVDTTKSTETTRLYNR